MLTSWWTKFKHYRFTDYDFSLVAMLVALSVFGVLAIGSVAPGEEEKQIRGLIISLVLMLVLSIMDYSVLLKLNWFCYIGAVGILALVRTSYGRSAYGARRWIRLFGILFQPSELAKILLILFFAQFIMKHRDRIRSLPFVLLCAALAAPPIYLTYKQPDLSTTIVMGIIICVILFVAGIDWKLVVTVLAVLVPSFILVIYRVLEGSSSLLTDYQQRRILAWLHPEDYAMSDA
ncbi:MAG: FtsW/RodA/SpoVE family cell cycle protein, partial [Butyrivibrio sp.]|nr:FtsW/RodA/SpoVE family cell cycle protein [Butyrivibrio sp.]